MRHGVCHAGGSGGAVRRAGADPADRPRRSTGRRGVRRHRHPRTCRRGRRNRLPSGGPLCAAAHQHAGAAQDLLLHPGAALPLCRPADRGGRRGSQTRARLAGGARRRPGCARRSLGRGRSPARGAKARWPRACLQPRDDRALIMGVPRRPIGPLATRSESQFALLEGEHPLFVGRDPRFVSREELTAAGHTPMSPLKAIRLRCLDCSSGQPAEVRLCTAVTCPSWPFRMGRNPWRSEVSEGRREAARRNVATLNARTAPQSGNHGTGRGKNATEGSPAPTLPEAALMLPPASTSGPKAEGGGQ
ncbi:conserved hypothetical protein [Candidatus Defluviicoccus seviourii]|uniref:Uncharacterized protein n=1 Tax=Candidatus Defluviicoccus seviourii TaxID=2565273 RepID=A0A564WHA2_9PROT|nr:conserved hypothetical protein [Candidatus Defluviicoccus seviourii]